MFKKLFLAMTLLVVVFGTTSCAEQTKGFPFMGDEKCLMVENGARLRSTPSVPGKDGADNVLFEVEMTDHKKYKSASTQFSVDTPQGIAAHEDHNGRWYGIRTADLKRALGEELASKLPREDNALTWVNDDRASLCKK